VLLLLPNGNPLEKKSKPAGRLKLMLIMYCPNIPDL